MSVRIVYKLLPFSEKSGHRDFEQGKNLKEMIEELGLGKTQIKGAEVINDRYIKDDCIESYVPKDGEVITLKVLPQKDKLATFLPLVLAVAAPGIGASLGKAWGIGSAAGTAVVTFAGALLMNSLIKPPAPPTRPQREQGAPVFSIGAARNRLDPTMPVPYLMGETRVFPPYAARPYTMNDGNDQILHCLFAICGYNDKSEIKLRSHRIGDVSEDNFSAFERFEKPYSEWTRAEKNYWYPNILQEEKNLPVDKLDGGGQPTSLTMVTEPDSTGFTVDLAFANGLFWNRDDGSVDPVEVDYKVSYRPYTDPGGNGTSEWLVIPASRDHEVSTVVSPATVEALSKPIQWNGQSWLATPAGQLKWLDTQTGTWSNTINYNVKVDFVQTNAQSDIWHNNTYLGNWGDVPVTSGVGISHITGTAAIPALPGGRNINPKWVDAFHTGDLNGIVVGATDGTFYRLTLSLAQGSGTATWVSLTLTSPNLIADTSYSPQTGDKMLCLSSELGWNNTTGGPERAIGALHSLIFVSSNRLNFKHVGTTLYEDVTASTALDPQLSSFIPDSFVTTSLLENVVGDVKDIIATSTGILAVGKDGATTRISSRLISRTRFVAPGSIVSGAIDINGAVQSATFRLELPDTEEITDASTEFVLVDNTREYINGASLLSKEDKKLYLINGDGLKLGAGVISEATITAAPTLGTEFGLFYGVDTGIVVYADAATYAQSSSNSGVQRVNAKSLSKLRITKRVIGLTPHKWEVKVERISTDTTNDPRVSSRLFVENIKSHRDSDVINTDLNVYTVAVKIRATDQLNGAIDDYNCIASRAIPVNEKRTIGYAGRANAIDVVDTLDPTNPEILSTTVSNTPEKIITTDSGRYLFSAGLHGVDVYDAQNNSNLSLLGNQYGVNIRDLRAIGDTLFSSTLAEVKVADITNPASITNLTAISPVYDEIVAIESFEEDELLYVFEKDFLSGTTYAIRLRVYDVSTPASISFVTELHVYNFLGAANYRPIAKKNQDGNGIFLAQQALTLTDVHINGISTVNPSAPTRLKAGGVETLGASPTITGGMPNDLISYRESPISATEFIVCSFEGSTNGYIQVVQKDVNVNYTRISGVGVGSSDDRRGLDFTADGARVIAIGEDKYEVYNMADPYSISLTSTLTGPSPGNYRAVTAPATTTDEWFTVTTGNPAWYYIDILTGYGAKEKLDRDQNFYLPEIKEFAKMNQLKNRMVNQYITEHTTPLRLLESVLSIGRATWGTTDGKYSVVTDEIKDVPTAFYSPRFMVRDSFSRNYTYITLPHAIRVSFLDETNDWQETTRIVYDDGFDVHNTEIIEDMAWEGVTNPDLVYSLARYHLAQIRLRPYTDVFTVGADFLDVKRGSLIHYQHDCVLSGKGDGRIKSFTTNGSSEYTSVTLDSQVLSVTTDTYRVEIVSWDNRSVLADAVVAADGWNNTFNFVTPLAASNNLQAGMRVLTWDASLPITRGVVVRVVPSVDLTAELTVQPYNEAIPLAADGAAIPAYVPSVTIDPDIKKGKPEPPQIVDVKTDETVLVRSIDGSLEPRIAIFVNPSVVKSSGNTTRGVVPTHLQARAKRVANTEEIWIESKIESAINNEISIEGVDIGDVYHVQVRYVSRYGEVSAWVYWDDNGDGNPDDVTIIGNSTPPPDLENFTASIPASDNTFTFRWDALEIPDFANVELRQTTTQDNWEDAAFLARSKTTQHKQSFLTTGERWIYAKAIDTARNESANAVVHKMDIKPPEAINLSGRAVGNVANLSFDNAKGSTFIPGTGVTEYYLPIREYEIYKGANFSSASQVGLTTTHNAIIEEIVSGTFTYWVVAVDVAGNRQTTPISTTVEVASNPDVLFVELLQDPGYLNPSDSENYSVQPNGDVLIPFDPTATWTDQYSPALTWNDPVVAGFPFLGQVGAITGYYEHEFDRGVVLASADLNLNIAYDSISGNPDIIPTIFYKEEAADPWISGGEGLTSVLATNVRYIRVKVEVRAQTQGGFVNFKDGTLDVTVSARIFREGKEVQANASDANGTRITYDAAFVIAQAPQITILGPGTSTWNAQIENWNATGFNLYIFDVNTGQRVSTTPGTTSVRYDVGGIL